MNFKQSLLSSAILSSLMLSPLALQAQEAAEQGEKLSNVEVLTITGILPTRFEAIAGSFSIIDEEYLKQRRIR